jgi:hypothetical protein
LENPLKIVTEKKKRKEKKGKCVDIAKGQETKPIQ